jgi:predicted transport protein
VAKTPDDMMGAVTGSLAARTGRSLDEWLDVVAASGIDPLDQNAVRRWLRTEHGMPQNSQWAIADAAARAAGWVRPSVAEYIDGQYRGAKAALRPIYDALASEIMGLGEDVHVEGRGGYTPFVRGRQFAAVAAAARDRVDLGLRFTDPPASGRLQPSTGPGQATHKIALRSVAEVNDEVRHLVRVAYDQNP